MKAGVTLVEGVGFNSGKHKASYYGEPLPEYSCWAGLLKRCYNKKRLIKYPTYRGCWVADEWLDFDTFYEWFTSYPYKLKGWHLDKDLLVKGNKLYSPSTCVFLPPKINQSIVRWDSKRGKYPIGVSFDKVNLSFIASCRTIEGKQRTKRFNNENCAFIWYKDQKEENLKMLAERYKENIDPRAYKALLKYEVDITD